LFTASSAYGEGMKILTVIWKHYDKDGETCNRCGKTGENVRQMTAELKQELFEKGIDLVYREKKLSKEHIDESNTILLNSVPLERYLPQTSVRHTSCDSCSCLAGVDVSCRAVVHKGTIHEDVPREFLVKAIRQAVRGIVK